MNRDPLTVVIFVVLILFGIYIGSYVPGLLIGTPAPILLIGFLAQTIAAIVAAVGVWWRQSWAPAVIVILGVAIAVTYLAEGYGLGLIAYNHALAGALLGLAITILMALYVSRNRRALN